MPLPEDTCGDFTVCALLRPILVFSTNDAWVFGHRIKSEKPTIYEGLALRWNGQTWSRESVAGRSFQAATATSPADLWLGDAERLVPGKYPFECNANGPAQRWDGDMWHKTADPSGACMEVVGLKAFAPDDVWSIAADHTSMVGPYGASFIARSDGREWTVVPHPPGVGLMLAIDGVAANDVWIVGTTPAPTTDVRLDPIALHWDGTEWTRFSIPGVEDRSVFLSSVRTFSSTDVWAVGSSGTDRPFVARWNGKDWARVVVPAGGALRDIALGGDQLVAVGYSSPPPFAPFVLRYDGNGFVKVPGPTTSGMLEGITSTDGSGRFWVSGTGDSGEAMIAEYVPPSGAGGYTSPGAREDVPGTTREPEKKASDGCGCGVLGLPRPSPAPFGIVAGAILVRCGVRRLRSRPRR